MTDKLLMAVCLGCLGALIGYAVCVRMKRKAEYYDDLDSFLRTYSESLSFSLDTLPDVMSAYPARSPLLSRQLSECTSAIRSGAKPTPAAGWLSGEEKSAVIGGLTELGTRSSSVEKGAVENLRIKLGAFGKRSAERYAKTGKAAVKLGFLAGLLAAVIFW